MTASQRRFTAAAVAFFLFARGADAGQTDLGGVSFEAPAGWRLEDRSRLRAGLAGLASPGAVDSVVASWTEDIPGASAARMVCARHDRELDVGLAGRRQARLLVEEALRRDPAWAGFRVRSVSVRDVGGAPAYRFRLGLATRETEVEQLVYVIGGGETHVLAFSAPRSRFAELEGAFEEVIASVTVRTRPALLHQASTWLWCALLGGMCATAFGALRRRDAIPAPIPDRPQPAALPRPGGRTRGSAGG